MPETIAMLRGTGEDSYWRRTLKYNLDGNIQAMLDESVHVLPESLGLRGHDSDEVVSEVASHVLATLSLRTAQMRVDELRVAGSEIKVSDFSTRTRFALRFADIRDDKDGRRLDGNDLMQGDSMVDSIIIQWEGGSRMKHTVIDRRNLNILRVQ